VKKNYSLIKGKIMQVPRIGIIGFGSLITQKESVNYHHTLATEGEFSFPNITELSLPTSLSRNSSQDTKEKRITLVVDPESYPQAVGVIKSAKLTLDQAKKDLAKREGTMIDNISYMAKSVFTLEGVTHDDKVTVNGHEYKGKFSGCNRQYKLKNDQAEKIARWLETSNYAAVLWTGLSPNIPRTRDSLSNGGHDITRYLADETTRINTEFYITLIKKEMLSAYMKDVFKELLANALL
jgi:hypothetical protein